MNELISLGIGIVRNSHTLLCIVKVNVRGSSSSSPSWRTASRGILIGSVNTRVARHRGDFYLQKIVNTISFISCAI